MFDAADLTENGILCWKIQFTFCVFCLLAIVFHEIYRGDCFNKRKRKTRMESLLKTGILITTMLYRQNTTKLRYESTQH